ncbi:MAG TPA: ADOP family duplicated permease [Longimicrobiales bacterium]|nr:ADOP family duplicated permease [Longimicrobiales bacterium]
MLASLRDDFRLAFRSIRRAPGPVLVAVVSLGLAIGANTAVLAVADAYFLRPLPYETAERLILVWETTPRGERRMTVSPGNFSAWRERAGAFEDLAAYNIDFAAVSGVGDAERIRGSIVTGGFFPLLGVTPLLGTGILPEHDRPEAEAVVVISHGLWQQRFGGAADVVGRTLRLDGEPHTIVGVMRPEYRQPERDWRETAYWRPLRLDAGDAHDFGSRYLRVIGRLGASATLPAAREELGAMARELAQEHPVENAGYGVNLVPLADDLFSTARPALLLLLAGAGFILLIVSVNLSNLLLVRSQRRARDFAVRAALGAGRARLARQVFAEAAVVALVGAAAGWLLVMLTGDALRALQTEHLSDVAQLRLDVRVAGVALAVAIATTFAIGVLPALRSGSHDLRTILVSGARAGTARGSTRLREAVVVAELALTVALLVSVALLGRSYLKLTGVDLGFQPREVLTMEIVMPSASFPNRDVVIRGQEELLQRIEALPGVRSAGMISDLPFTVWNMSMPVRAPGVHAATETWPLIEFHTIAGDYFGTMGMPLLGGEPPRAPTGEDAPHGVVINRQLAEQFWAGEDPLGRELRLGGSDTDAPALVVGVVDDILDDGFAGAIEPRLFVAPGPGTSRRWMAVTVAAERRAGDLAVPVRRLIRDYDAEISVDNVQTLENLLAGTVAGRRAVLSVLLLFAGLTLLLALVGIYAVTSYGVNERTHELGVRAALGANRRELLRLVLGRATVLALAGLAGGLVLALAAGSALAGTLHGVTPSDPASLVAVAVVLGASALLGALLPGLRAARVEPITALKSE